MMCLFHKWSKWKPYSFKTNYEDKKEKNYTPELKRDRKGFVLNVI